MILFWLLAAAMLLVALALLLPALAGGGRDGGVERDALNIAVFRDQLVELEADHAEGNLTDAQLEAARRELQRELLDEVDVDGEAAARAGARGKLVAPLVAVAVPLLAIGLYLQLGETHLLTDEGQAELAQAQQAAHDMANVDGMIQQLAARLQQDPDNLEGWQMLARSLLAVQRYPDAAKAFAQAIRIAGEQPDLLADYAEALAMSGDGQIIGDPLEIVERVLAMQPMHEKGLWLAGIAAFQRGEFAVALDYWNRLGQVIPEEHPNRRLLADYMAQARARVEGGAPQVAAVGDGIPAATDTAIEVTVELAPALADRLADGDTLFVFARAAQGPRMPLAIVRQAAGAFPVTVTLDDSQAMMPSLRLSGFSEVVVGARVSRSGNATPQPGDLQGTVDRILVGADRQVTVVIGEAVGAAQPMAGASTSPPAPAQPPAQPSAAAGGALEVAVALDPALNDRVAPGDTLFVYARATEGPRMPLAIVRRQAGDLPLTVTLDDSQAMAPNFRLSGFAEVNVGARISKSGDALPQPGDLQGSVPGVRVGHDRRVELTISEAL
jgi:cytochrome c-type biogenesis protein CcmH